MNINISSVKKWLRILLKALIRPTTSNYAMLLCFRANISDKGSSLNIVMNRLADVAASGLSCKLDTV